MVYTKNCKIVLFILYKKKDSKSSQKFFSKPKGQRPHYLLNYGGRQKTIHNSFFELFEGIIILCPNYKHSARTFYVIGYFYHIFYAKEAESAPLSRIARLV